jgi:hypothetical protein
MGCYNTQSQTPNLKKSGRSTRHSVVSLDCCELIDSLFLTEALGTVPAAMKGILAFRAASHDPWDIMYFPRPQDPSNLSVAHEWQVGLAAVYGEP